MAFFGANNSLATSTPAKPGGVFGSFSGAQAGGTAATTFGGTGLGTSFGAVGTNPASAPGLTGFSTFGTNTAATSAAPALGGGFSAFGPATNTTTLGAGGTAPNTGFSFGTTGLGGTAGTTTQSAFSGFGAVTQPTTAVAPTGFANFGTTATTSTAPAFSGFGAQTGTFGATNTFGTNTGTLGNFGRAPNATVTPGFGGFGGNTNFMLGQPQQLIPQLTQDEAFAQSIFNVSIYGDERDAIIAKWNYLQGMWGTGKSFYAQTAPPVEISPENYLMRLKAIGYSHLPGRDNKLGLVALNFNKPMAEIKTQQPQIITALNGMLGNKPNMQIVVDTIKEYEEKKCQMIIYVEERMTYPPHEIKRILATETSGYLNMINFRGQLVNFGVCEVLALVQPDEEQLKQYLAGPPKGIDPRMWRQAKLDNPDTARLIPVPMIGFTDLKWRLKCQENEMETHKLYLKKLDKDLAELRNRHCRSTAKVLEYKRNIAELGHRILSVIVRQECTRKLGVSLSPEEEILRSKLEKMQALVTAPTQFRGRLSELLSQMRMQRNQYSPICAPEYKLDKDAEVEMKVFLCMQQEAMEVLIGMVKKDTKILEIIKNGMSEFTRG